MSALYFRVGMKSRLAPKSVEELRSMFSYDPESGEVRRIQARGNRASGSLVGVKNTFGHLNVEIDGRQIGVHRIAWAMFYGEWPEQDIDHANGIPSDNRISNLRLCTVSQNIANSRAYKRSKNLPRGVYEHRGRITARVTHNGKQFYLGRFDSVERAALAASAKRKALFGEFARDD